MRFLIDECLHESLAGVAHAAGFDAIHVNYAGLSGATDQALAARIMRDEYTFVTNNRLDFLRLFGAMELHAGLIILVPNVVPALRRALFQAAILFLAGREPVNTALEVTIAGKTILFAEYQLPR